MTEIYVERRQVPAQDLSDLHYKLEPQADSGRHNRVLRPPP